MVCQICLYSYLKSKYDASLSLRTTANGVVFVLMYVDDIVITSTDLSIIHHLKQHLQKSFHMKDLGNLAYFLGLQNLGWYTWTISIIAQICHGLGGCNWSPGFATTRYTNGNQCKSFKG